MSLRFNTYTKDIINVGVHDVLLLEHDIPEEIAQA